MIPSLSRARDPQALGKSHGKGDRAIQRQLAWGRAAFSAVAAACALACSQPMNGADATRQPAIEQAVINGRDDRRELYELGQADQRDRVGSSVAALMWSHRIDYREPTVLRTASLRDAIGACSDEAFVEQPAAAVCSAVLIDDDLVLTAGHCLGDPSSDASSWCQRLLIVFDYHYARSGELALSGEQNVYTCRRVVHHEKMSNDADFMDLAVLKLDRSVGAEFAPAVIASNAPRPGDSLLAASHGAGLPLKIDSGGEVIDVPEGRNYFVASTDSFAGGSGSPLFNADMELVGHQVRGLADWQFDGDCMRAVYADEPREQHQLATRSIESLCDSGWPSERLCRRRTECGDGFCAVPETVSSCPVDCAATRCGDGVCELSERHECSADCAAYVDVPADWMADPARYQPSKPYAARPPALEPSGGCSIAHHYDSGARWVWTWIAVCGLTLRRSRPKQKTGCG